MTYASPNPATVLERSSQTVRYPEARVIVLDDNINTFDHVVSCLRKIIPGMTEEVAWQLANKVDTALSANRSEIAILV